MAPTAAAPELLSLATARSRVLAAANPLPIEPVPLGQAWGRALGRDIVAPHGLPPFRNSSMDGVAVRSADTLGAAAHRPVDLRVVGVVAAGRAAAGAIGPGEAMRIMTGAMVPEGADAVVPVEEIEPGEGRGGQEQVHILRPVEPGAHLREAGADLALGERALPSGRELSAHDIALLAALGQGVVPVGARPKVAVISTGDELLPVEAPLEPGSIRDSNLPMLEALLRECGSVVTSAVRAGDDPAEVASRIEQGLEAADVVITVGGVSAGEFDPVKAALGSIGGIALWRVAMKPGRPQAFGTPHGKLFFGLPGNPASVACVFEVLVRPALRKLPGFSELDRPHLPVRAAVAVASRKGRTDLIRARLTWRDGEWWAAPAGDQVSGHLAPQSRAEALLIVPEERSSLAPGDPARALLLRWPSPAA
ncbi:MAG TPA: gephyrin-like molybdotransferase Glp [Candidatus Eisenbacteria bacterium]